MNLDADERRLSLIVIFSYLRFSAEICVPKVISLKTFLFSSVPLWQTKCPAKKPKLLKSLQMERAVAIQAQAVTGPC